MNNKQLTAAALTVGILWGGAMLLAGLTAPMGWMSTWVALWADIYIGYAPGVLGAIIGFIWGFVDAAIIVMAGGYLYRVIARSLEAANTERSTGYTPRV